MHEIHKTEGFILHSKEAGEANKLYWIFTKDFGTILATAQSVRAESSKLKGHLSDFGNIYLEAVRGKDLWRITNAYMKDDLPFSLEARAKRVYGRTLQTLLRLSGTEGEDEKLFLHIVDLAETLKKNFYTDEELNFLDTLSITKLLRLSGYLAQESEHEDLLFAVPLSLALSRMTLEKNKELIVFAEHAFTESQL